jgi:hypothetical protein
MNADNRTRPLAMRLWMLQTAETYPCVDQIGDGVNERPHPLVVGLWVDSTGQRTDGQTPGALLGVHLHEVKGPKQMLQAAALWEEGVPLKQPPCFFDHEQARPSSGCPGSMPRSQACGPACPH